jgi:hypothetical protein
MTYIFFGLGVIFGLLIIGSLVYEWLQDMKDL